jgi:hypothetical protein
LELATRQLSTEEPKGKIAPLQAETAAQTSTEIVKVQRL